MPKPQLFQQKRFDELTTGWNAASENFASIASQLRALTTLGVDPDLVEMNLKFADYFAETASFCSQGRNLARDLRDHVAHYGSEAAMMESFLRTLAGDDPLGKFREGKAEEQQLVGDARSFAATAQKLDATGQSLMAQQSRLKAALTQKYGTEFP